MSHMDESASYVVAVVTLYLEMPDTPRSLAHSSERNPPMFPRARNPASCRHLRYTTRREESREA
jgi:hypothetical protein